MNNPIRFFAFLLFFQLAAGSALPAQPGCTDPLANNFDPDATTNDGSCTYPVTNYALTLKTNLSTTLDETSGVIMANGALWTHNDGGNAAALYKIDTLSNAILQTVTIGGATNVDWEDITFDGTNFYIGDFGNNANGNRTDLKIYKFPLSAIPSGTNVTVPAGQVQVIHFSYEDQTNFNPTGSNNTRFDCEAMIYAGGGLHLFTKNWIDKITTHYTLPATAGTYEAVNEETFDVDGLVTAADISPLGVIMLLGYESAGGTPFFWMLWDYPAGVYFGGNKRRINLGSFFSTGQIEGICFRNNSYGYVSNEKFSVFVPARLYSFQVSQWLQPIFFPVELIRFGVREEQGQALLEWETAAEQGNAGFQVERSADGRAFQDLGFVPAANAPGMYRFTDPSPPAAAYYRLRQLDLDGAEQVSAIEFFQIKKNERDCLVFPNPVVAGQAIRLAGADAASEVEICDAYGRLAWKGAGLEHRGVPLPPGIYFFQWENAREGNVCRGKLLLR